MYFAVSQSVCQPWVKLMLLQEVNSMHWQQQPAHTAAGLDHVACKSVNNTVQCVQLIYNISLHKYRTSGTELNLPNRHAMLFVKQQPLCIFSFPFAATQFSCPAVLCLSRGGVCLSVVLRGGWTSDHLLFVFLTKSSGDEGTRIKGGWWWRGWEATRVPSLTNGLSKNQYFLSCGPI